MSNVPIVQGVAVEDNKYGQPASAPYQNASEGSPINVNYADGQQSSMQHTKQPNQFRDVFWAVLFIGHFIPLILYAVFSSGNNAGEEGGSSYGSIDLGPHLFWICMVSLVSVGLASLSLEAMMHNTDGLVKAALIFSVVFSLAVGIFGLMVGQILMGILGFVSFAFGCCYAKLVWHRIPYAAVNLRTALTAVRLNMGLTAFAYGSMVVAFAWSILFFLGFGNALNQSSTPIVFCFLVSYYWVHQVLQNTVHVSVAGVVGTWWFAPHEASSFFSPAVKDSMFRATTYSFGSICLGSLLVALVRALRMTLEHARNNDDMKILVCLLECILRCIEDMIEYLNKWAYVYVGLYGFSYMDAGREVINLFKQRGWTVIITDDLVDNVLFMMSLVIGLIAGLLAHFAGGEALSNAGVDNAGMVAFGVGFLMGFLFASIGLGVVASAVNTVIVCYCEAPAEFQNNHPQLSAEMRAAWTSAWPDLSI